MRSRHVASRSGLRGPTPGQEGRHLMRQRPPKLIWYCEGRSRGDCSVLSCPVSDGLRRP